MEYAQLNEAGTVAIQVTTHGPVAWDANNYCSAEALIKDDRAAPFRVVELTPTSQPAFNAATQNCYRDGCEYVGGVWRYKWTTTSLTAQEIAQRAAEQALAAREAAKVARSAAVAAITVTTSSGRVFDGDETSQERMARAILVLQATGTPSTTWVLTNNSPVTVTVAELVEALALAGAAQSAIWVIA
jgi:hypothetical protein